MVDPKPIPPAPAPAYTEPMVGSQAVVPEDMLTEQEKDVSSDVPGVGPVSASEPSPGPVTTIEELGIGPRTPYPDGDPPPVEDVVTRSSGIKKGEPREKLGKDDPAYRAPEPKTDPFGKPI